MQLDVVNNTAAEPIHDNRLSRRREAQSIDIRELEHDLQRQVNGEVRFDKGSRALYATDASNYRQVPIGVVVPRSVDDMIAAVAVCRRHSAPIVARGGGTSLSGQCCNVAVVIDTSKYVNRIVEINPDEQYARVQPGVLHDQLTDITREKYNLTFGPDPSTHKYCTFGGMIGNNACGVHSVMTGRTSDCIRELDVLTYDGQRLRVGATTDEQLASIIKAGGRRGSIYRGLKDIRDRHSDQIRAEYPDIPRRVSGYNLDELLPEKGFNVARSLVGTEGTCALVLEATVNLVHFPSTRTLVVLGYKDIFEAADHVPEILEHQPLGLEAMDGKLVSFMQQKGLHLDDIGLLPDGEGWLLIEIGGESREESDAKAGELKKALERHPNGPNVCIYDDPAVEQRIWVVRESGLGATARIRGMADTWSGWEDVGIHPNRLGDYLREFRTLLDKFDYDCALYGHFGDGCVHCRIDFDLYTQAGIKKYMSFLDEAADLVVQYDGSFSAEHGDGQSKAIFLPKMYSKELIGAFRQFKALWDPDWKMNPGKVIYPDRPDENLRLGADYQPQQPATHFQFPNDDGSFARATVRCVGVGKCRRTDDAFMCPSFLVTHEEEHTTRGRAHMLFEMFHGGVIDEGWKSIDVRKSLDLCLACKGCKVECPVHVDIAMYKSEFLSHYYEGKLRPRDHYALGMIDHWARLASVMPGLANWFSRSGLFSPAVKWLAGIAPERELPAFARQTFSQWFRRHRRAQSSTDSKTRGDVVLWPDVFNDYFFPQTLQATVEVLEYFGYAVKLPDGRIPAIRPSIHYGMLERAKRQLRYAVELLRDFARAGVPVIGVEPSTVAVFRDELVNLFPQDQDAHRISRNVLTLPEFIINEELELPQVRSAALLHVHCHEKAVLQPGALRDVLQKMAVDVVEPEIGCCGMAGSFGFERDHYEMSQQIGERKLFPSVRQQDSNADIVVTGFSCREHIAQATGRSPLHIAEFIAKAMADEGGTANSRNRAISE